ncbi:MAG: Fe-S cluster domain-containing protein [Desulfovibrionales bacterium]|nr:Fe-S cluster domain-containing protein [Desulfovibrionales bacterium]
MDEVIYYAVISLGTIGVSAAIILFFVARQFRVIEDPKIDEVEEVLPGANCGGCGFPGCRGFAEAVVNSANTTQAIDGLSCPVGGNEVMGQVTTILGLEAEAKDPQIAVVRCAGSPDNSPKKFNYDGAQSCAFVNNLFSGENGCAYGCLGCGDCVDACGFDAIAMDPATGLPSVEDSCVACGACVDACPRNIIELRNRGKKERRIFVSCVNKEKGGPAKKNCAVACIGCGKCAKVCKFEAITVENSLAYIDPAKCKLCRKCVDECPTGAIHALNFPVRKPKKEKAASETADVKE